ncbi:MAG: hypothetical protein V4726_18215 [Verrucomicrobiota bacterium]
MKFPLILCSLTCLLSALPSCRSSGEKKETDESRELSTLGDPTPMLQIGGYYKLGGVMMNGFFTHVPNFTDVLPDHYLRRGTVVQLLDPTVGEGWARVKDDKLGIGYTKFNNLKIVPYDQRPKPKLRDPDDELDRSMGLQ